MRRLGVALLVCLVALAGCSALPGDGGGPPGTTLAGDGEGADGTRVDAERAGWPGAGDAPTWRTVGADEGVPVVDGLTLDGVSDGRALGERHRTVLAGTSYSLSAAWQTVTDDGTVSTTRVDGAFADRPGRFRWTLTRRDADARPTLRYRAWGNGTHVHRDLDRGGEDGWSEVVADRPERLGSERYLSAAPTQGETVGDLLAAFEVRTASARRTMDGMRYVVRSETLDERVALVDDPNVTVRNASLFGRVDADGVVRYLHVEYDVVRDGAVRHETYELSVGRVGHTRVQRPDWVTAPAGAGTTTAP